MKKLTLLSLIICFYVNSTGANIIINTPTVWNTSRVVNDNVLILPGGSLTINGYAIVEMGSSNFIATLSSTPAGTWGGKLTLENCTLKGIGTTGVWQGINIIGNPNYSQVDTRMSRLNVIDNVLIEGASVGIANFDHVGFTSLSPSNSSGGIIKANGLTIQKAHFCVYMRHYQNFNTAVPSIKLNDVSAFTRCSFKKTIGGWVSSELVVLDEVTGVRFLGCSFSAEAPFVGKIQDIDGLLLGEAGAIVKEHNDPTKSPQIVNSSFTNLNNGIRAYNNGTLYRITVENTNFIDNQFGIVLIGANFPYLVNNNFTINPYPGNDQVGIALQSTKQYTVMENTVNYTGTNTYNRVFGININNGGDIAEDVYKNTINNCNYGLKADGSNRHTGFQIGLRYICNDLNNYDPPAHDISIDGGIADPSMGIAVFQGVLDAGNMLGAMNDFSGTLNTGNSIVNNSNYITYVGPVINGNGFTGLVGEFNDPF